MRDEILDGLLAALVKAPHDEALVAVIADRLEGADGNERHPAAAWWRECVGGLGCSSAKGAPRRLCPLMGLTGWICWERHEPAYPGVTDLCRRLDAACGVTYRTVRVPACEQHEGWNFVEVTLRWVCPECGAPRGEPFEGRSYDGSRTLAVHQWGNSCGHIDFYSLVREEAREGGAP